MKGGSGRVGCRVVSTWAMSRAAGNCDPVRTRKHLGMGLPMRAYGTNVFICAHKCAHGTGGLCLCGLCLFMPVWSHVCADPLTHTCPGTTVGWTPWAPKAFLAAVMKLRGKK